MWVHIWYVITKDYLQAEEIFFLVLAYPRFAIHFRHCYDGWYKYYGSTFVACRHCHQRLVDWQHYRTHSMECDGLQKALRYNVGGKYHYAVENLYSFPYCPEQKFDVKVDGKIQFGCYSSKNLRIQRKTQHVNRRANEFNNN